MFRSRNLCAIKWNANGLSGNDACTLGVASIAVVLFPATGTTCNVGGALVLFKSLTSCTGVGRLVVATDVSAADIGADTVRAGIVDVDDEIAVTAAAAVVVFVGTGTCTCISLPGAACERKLSSPAVLLVVTGTSTCSTLLDAAVALVLTGTCTCTTFLDAAAKLVLTGTCTCSTFFCTNTDLVPPCTGVTPERVSKGNVTGTCTTVGFE